MSDKLTKDERAGLELWAKRTGAIAGAILSTNPPKDVENGAAELNMVAVLIMKILRRNDYFEAQVDRQLAQIFDQSGKNISTMEDVKSLLDQNKKE